MKKNYLFGGGVALIAVALIAAASARRNPATGLAATPAEAVPGATDQPAAREKVVQDLISILNETKSREVLVLTIGALHQLGPDARPAIPAILRSVERCDLLRGALDASKDSDQSRLGSNVMEVLQAIVRGEKPSKEDKSKPPAPCCAAAPPAGPPATVQPPAPPAFIPPPTVPETRY